MSCPAILRPAIVLGSVSQNFTTATAKFSVRAFSAFGSSLTWPSMEHVQCRRHFYQFPNQPINLPISIQQSANNLSIFYLTIFIIAGFWPSAWSAKFRIPPPAPSPLPAGAGRVWRTGRDRSRRACRRQQSPGGRGRTNRCVSRMMLPTARWARGRPAAAATSP